MFFRRLMVRPYRVCPNNGMEFINKKYKLFISPSPKDHPRNCKNQKEGVEGFLLGMVWPFYL